MNKDQIILTNHDFQAITLHSVEELKKLELNRIRNVEHQALTHWAVENNNKEFLEKLLLAGMDVNTKNIINLTAGHCIYKSKDPFDILSLMVKYNLVLEPDDNRHLIKYLLCDLVNANTKKIKSYSQAQIMLLQGEEEFLKRIAENKNITMNDLSLLSIFTPETLNYIINNKNINVFSVCDILGDNLISYILNSNIKNHTYLNLNLFDELMSMLTHKQINHLNKNQENFLWHVNNPNDERISMLKKYGLNFNQTNKDNLGVMETRCRYSPHLTEKFLENGSHLSLLFLNDIFALSEEDMCSKYKMGKSNYVLFSEIAKQQYHIYQKDEIEKSLSKENISVINKNKRL